MSLQTKVQSYIAPIIDEHDLYLEKIVLAKNGKNILVRVVVDLIDTPGGVSSDVIVDISRLISKVLDEKDPIKQPYTLEVTTAGATRKITDARLWKRSVGRYIKYTFQGKSFEAKVVSVLGEDKVVLADKKDGVEKEYMIENIQNAQTIIVF